MDEAHKGLSWFPTQNFWSFNIISFIHFFARSTRDILKTMIIPHDQIMLRNGFIKHLFVSYVKSNWRGPRKLPCQFFSFGNFTTTWSKILSDTLKIFEMNANIFIKGITPTNSNMVFWTSQYVLKSRTGDKSGTNK